MSSHSVDLPTQSSWQAHHVGRLFFKNRVCRVGWESGSFKTLLSKLSTTLLLN